MAPLSRHCRVFLHSRWLKGQRVADERPGKARLRPTDPASVKSIRNQKQPHNQHNTRHEQDKVGRPVEVTSDRKCRSNQQRLRSLMFKVGARIEKALKAAAA